MNTLSTLPPPGVHASVSRTVLASAAEKLRILLLEDVATDAELVQRTLRKDGLQFTSECVGTRDAFEEALQRFKPDIVLSDYSLPEFDGLSAVRIVRDRYPDLPFVLVTGVLDDEAAVAVVKAGASDYVRKDRMARLPVAVRNALEEAALSHRRRAAEERLASLARSDVLTGLANRAYFLDRLRESFSAARRGRRSFAVFYLDLDHFKDINDSLGHPAGDRLLCEVADRIRQGVRGTDVVARLGGDEFAVLQSDVNEPPDAGTLAAKLLKRLAVPFSSDGAEMHVTASIGIALYQSEIRVPEDMLRQADLALYRAKDEGRDRYCFHSADLDEQVRDRLRLSEELYAALEHDEFEIYYQPQIAQPDCRIDGMEALIRWHHPRLGLILPPDFIPVAERSGTMQAVGRWVMQSVCGQIDRWRSADIPIVKVAINLSPVQFKASTSFERDASEALEHWRIAPAMVELELSEVDLLETTRAHAVDLQRVRLLGLNLVIDGFGMGHFSLDHIGTFGFSCLKIAPRLVAGALADRGGAAIVRAAIGLARELGIQVIGTGVETAEQLQFLTDAGCTVAQGYYICPPVPAHEAGLLLQQGRIEPGTHAGGPGEASQSLHQSPYADGTRQT